MAAADASASAARVSGWYLSIPAPPFAAPAALMQPVSVMLHLMLGIAAWLIFRRGSLTPVRAVLKWWGWLLLFDAAWSPVFFGLHRPDLALIIMVPLLPLTGISAYDFARIDRTAALLMFPYAIWMCYSAYLIAGFFWLDPN